MGHSVANDSPPLRHFFKRNHRRIQGEPGDPPPPPQIEMLPIMKVSQKRLFFFQFQFLLASSRTTVINNNIDPRGPGPSIYFLPTNLNGPPKIIFKYPQFKWVPNNNIVPGGPRPFNLIFASQFKNAPCNNI